MGHTKTGLADLPDPRRVQPLQRARTVRQPAREPTGLSRPPSRRCGGGIVCEHLHLIERNHHGSGQTDYYFLELPAAFKHLQAALLKQPGVDREMVEVLGLVLHHNEPAVLSAVEPALEAGAPCKNDILNVLHRLIDSNPAPAPVTSPRAFELSAQPQADVLRQDRMRAARHASRPRHRLHRHYAARTLDARHGARRERTG